MTWDEQDFIELCKKQIEQRYAFGNGNGYTQRDLEQLAEVIEEKSGIRLSLSTLKRLWKGNFKQSPQLATLNALAALLDYKDWQSFKLQNRPKEGVLKASKKSLNQMEKRTIAVILVLLLVTVVLLINSQKSERRLSELKVNGPVIFATKQTVSKGIPNTVIFNYDVSNVEADSFFIQQTWNDFHKVAIDPKKHVFSSIYFESGFHRARLLANDSVIAMQPVHILSNGWEPHVYYSYEEEPIHFEGELAIAGGQLHLSKSLLLSRNVDTSRNFFSRIGYSERFGVSSNDFSLTSRMKVDHIKEALCPWMQVIVVTEKHIFYVNTQAKGCERNIEYKLGEIYRSGESHDMSGLGSNPYDWQNVALEVKNKHAKILLNDEVVYEETFEEDFGDIMGLIYLFDGTGSIDYVHLKDGAGHTVFEEDFQENPKNLP